MAASLGSRGDPLSDLSASNDALMERARVLLGHRRSPASHSQGQRRKAKKGDCEVEEEEAEEESIDVTRQPRSSFKGELSRSLLTAKEASSRAVRHET